MTHGNDGKLWANNGSYTHNQLFEYFTDRRCHPSLKGKPKMFFIQVMNTHAPNTYMCMIPLTSFTLKACRGLVHNKDADKPSTNPRGAGKGNFLSDIPVNRDFLVAYSTVPGTV